jgi:hypothetical protein
MKKYQKDNYRKRAKELNEGINEKISIPASLQKSYMDNLVEKLMIEKTLFRSIAKDLVEDAYDIASKYLRQFKFNHCINYFTLFLPEIDSTIFCILSISHFYENKSDIFPCEIGIAKFSLKEGVIDSLGMTINPGALPVGASDEAIKHSQETHQFPIPKRYDHEDNYVEILLKISKFLSSDFQRSPVFFTEGGFIDNRTTQKLLINTTRALKKIFEKAGEYEIADDLKVLPISFLLYYLHRCKCRDQQANGQEDIDEIDSTTKAHETFYANENYEYSTEGCEYHDENDNKKNCCLSKVRRFGYKLAELCCDRNKYQLIEGCHYPVGYTIEA